MLCVIVPLDGDQTTRGNISFLSITFRRERGGLHAGGGSSEQSESTVAGSGKGKSRLKPESEE